MKKRGAAENIKNRFDLRIYEIPAEDEYDLPDDEKAGPETQLFIDDSRSIISRNESVDIPFVNSVNPYRGCEHGCIYCYARPSHEYLGFSPGLDFETKITFKPEADKLLEKELLKKSYKPEVINFSGITDCYQPVERRLKLTRKCLQVVTKYNNPFMIITKSSLIRRDIDIVSAAAKKQLASVGISIATLDAALAGVMEPRASSPGSRIKTIEALAAAGIPVDVIVSPVIPGLTDHEIPAILKAAKDAGATSASYAVLRLPYEVKELFVKWLEDNFAGKAKKVISKIRDLREGKLNDPTPVVRMKGKGAQADAIREFFCISRRKVNLDKSLPPLRTDLFNPNPLPLFD